MSDIAGSTSNSAIKLVSITNKLAHWSFNMESGAIRRNNKA